MFSSFLASWLPWAFVGSSLLFHGGSHDATVVTDICLIYGTARFSLASLYTSMTNDHIINESRSSRSLIELLVFLAFGRLSQKKFAMVCTEGRSRSRNKVSIAYTYMSLCVLPSFSCCIELESSCLSLRLAVGRDEIMVCSSSVTSIDSSLLTMSSHSN